MKADLHIHTTYSDGLSSPKEVVEAAIDKGIDIICITDHNEVKGASEAMKFAFDKNILIIPGIEVSTKEGHILGINVKKKIPKYLPAEKAIKEIKKQGGLSIIAHPFEKLFSFSERIKTIKSLSPDGIEVFNASLFWKRANKKALEYAQENNFIFTAGSDAHSAEYVGRGYLEFKEKICSIDDFLEVIKNRKGEVKGKPLNFFEIIKMNMNYQISNIFKL